MASRQQRTSLAGSPAGLRRAAIAGSLSLVVPGLGQLLLGARRRGQVMLAVTVALLLVALWQRSRGVVDTVELLVQPGAIAAILVGNVALALFRLYATLDAFRSGVDGVSPAPTPRVSTLGTASVLVSLSIAAVSPHVVAARYATVLDGTLGSVFTDPDGTAWAVEGASPRSPSGPGDGSEDAARWLDGGRLSVALLGSDAHRTRTGARIDALLVVSVDPSTGRTAVVSVERHLRDFPLPARLAGVWEDRCRGIAGGWELLNALYRCGDEIIADEVALLYPDAPDPAAAVVADTLSELLDLPIDHYVMVDMQGFVALVDALGGIRLDSGVPDPGDGCDWRDFDVRPAGVELDGKAALELVREREGTTSADRMGRQRCLLAAVAQEVGGPSLLWRFGSVAAVFREHVVTDLPASELPGLLTLLGQVDGDLIATVGVERPDHVSAGGRPHVEEIRATVRRALDGPRPPTGPFRAR